MARRNRAKKMPEMQCNCGGHGHHGLPMLLLIVGILWLLKDMGKITFLNTSFWPKILILVGIVMLVKKCIMKYKCSQ